MILSLPIVILLVALALISFFLSASETAIIGLSKIRLRHLVAKSVRHSQSIYRLSLKLDKFITAILIGNNFVNIAFSAIVTTLFVQILGDDWGVLAATVAIAVFVLIVCEITPKILATKHTEKIALFSAPLMEIMVGFLTPVVKVFLKITNGILWLFRIGPTKRSPLVTEEEIRLMIEIGKEEGVLSDEERRMLHQIFEFGDTQVGEVMIPRARMVAVSSAITSEELVNVFVEQGHARLPVYADSPDNIIGIVYSHDLLYILRDKGLFVLQDIMHKPYCVPGSTRVNELLRKFQADKIQIAIVVDAQNKAIGLLTLEDLIEEIVGEIDEDKTIPLKKKRFFDGIVRKGQ